MVKKEIKKTEKKYETYEKQSLKLEEKGNIRM
jgi:hypothetical protein